MEKSIECPYCKSQNVQTKSNYITCTEENCGSVIGVIISDENEWNCFKEYDGSLKENSRCGLDYSNKLNPFANTYSTFVQKGSKSFVTKNGKLIRSDIFYLHMINNTNHSEKEFNKLESIIDNATFDKFSSKVSTLAKLLIADFMESKTIIRGNNRKGFIANCLYYSCLHNGQEKKSGEICKIFDISKNDFAKGKKTFIKHFSDSKWSHILKS